MARKEESRLEILKNKNNIFSRMTKAENNIQSVQTRNVTAESAAEMTQGAVGVTTNGSFEVGTGSLAGGDLTGSFIAAPGVTFDGGTTYYGVGGMNAGTLTWGGNATDGKLYAGAGAVTLDQNGVQIQIPASNTSTNAVNWVKSGVQQSYITDWDDGTTNTFQILAPNISSRNQAINIEADAGNIAASASVVLTANSGTAGSILQAITLLSSAASSKIQMTGNVTMLNNLNVTGTITGQICIGQHAGNLVGATTATGTTSWFGVGITTPVTSGEATTQISVPAGVIKNFYVRTSTSQSAGGTLVFTLRKGGASQTVTCSVAAGGASGLFSDTTHSFTVAEGDQVNVQVVNNGSGASAAIRGWSYEIWSA